MIDLHIHSVYSDGTYSVNEILAEAQKNNVTAISITDHCTIEAYNEIDKNSKTIYSGRIVEGVEIDCVANNSKVHFLGYNFDKRNILENWLKEKFSAEKWGIFRKKEYEKLLEKMKENGIINNCNPIYDEKDNLPHTAVYKEIKRYAHNEVFFSEEEWNNFRKFFWTSTTNPKSPLYIDYSDILPSAEEVSAIIRKSNGKVFLAHVYSYGINNHINFINNLANNKIIDGIEVFYSNFTNEQINELYDYCRKNKLYMSGGSDSHGENGNIKIGIGCGNLNVPESILDEWV
ncbi:MAG: PHP domain-containing protein [Oscillospiraceae bacterium]|nr:PHP domain-containing protein [Oscillospiraceae bacterium]